MLVLIADNLEYVIVAVGVRSHRVTVLDAQ
jgi:hypothetical protein